jgi:hypothetical protein
MSPRLHRTNHHPRRLRHPPPIRRPRLHHHRHRLRHLFRHPVHYRRRYRPRRPCQLHRRRHRQPAILHVGQIRVVRTTLGASAASPLLWAVTARAAARTARHRRQPRRHRRPRCRRTHRHLPLHRQLPRGRSPWASVTAGTLGAAAADGNASAAATIRCRSAGRPPRRPPIVRASPMLRPTRCPQEVHSMGARQPAPGAASCTSGQPSPPRPRDKWDT